MKRRNPSTAAHQGATRRVVGSPPANGVGGGRRKSVTPSAAALAPDGSQTLRGTSVPAGANAKADTKVLQARQKKPDAPAGMRVVSQRTAGFDSETLTLLVEIFNMLNKWDLDEKVKGQT